MQQPNFVIYVPWILWFLSWIGAALLTNAPKRLTLAQDAAYRTLTIIASVTLLFGFLPDPGFDVRNMLWQPLDGPLGWLLVGVVCVAFCFAWWARICLGFALPGSAKQQQPFVEAGPYRWVRHPVYASLIIAAIATALVFGRPSSMGGAALLTIAFLLKILFQESALRAETGAFEDYAERVPMLIPGLRFGAPRTAAVVTRYAPAEIAKPAPSPMPPVTSTLAEPEPIAATVPEPDPEPEPEPAPPEAQAIPRPLRETVEPVPVAKAAIQPELPGLSEAISITNR